MELWIIIIIVVLIVIMSLIAYNMMKDPNLAMIDKNNPSEILPYLYLGNMQQANNVKSLKKVGITHIINTINFPEFLYMVNDTNNKIKTQRLSFEIDDNPKENIKQYFDKAYDFIENATKEGGKVLVHCMVGVSRSATIVIMYIARRFNLTVDEALDYVKKRRNIIEPNIGFMKQLHEYIDERNK